MNIESKSAFSVTSRLIAGGDIVPSLTEQSPIKEFTDKLDRALSDIKCAVKRRQEVQADIGELKKRLDNRSTVEAIKAFFSSKNIEELAKFIEGLGLSLELTQSTLDLVLQVQTQKNKLLHTFNEVLVDKIARIQGDTHTLDSNQKEAALVFLGELQEQINEQIHQQELVDSHEFRLRDHEQWRQNKDESDATLVSQTSQLKDETVVLKCQIEIHELKLAAYEEIERQSRSFKAILIRNVFSIIAITLGVASLVLTLKP